MKYNIEKRKKQTYIPKICSIFVLTTECMFGIIQLQEQMFANIVSLEGQGNSDENTEESI